MIKGDATLEPTAKRVAFLFIAQDHQVPHSLPIACTLSSRYPDLQVLILARSEAQLALCRDLAELYPDNRLKFDVLRVPMLVRATRMFVRAPKRLVLWANRRRLNEFDALIVSERTSLHLKKMGVKHPKYIHAFHGSGGHDKVDDPRLRKFDLLLVPNADRLRRIVAAGNATSGHAIVVGSSKIDLVKRLEATQRPLFNNNRPTILYNPHHRKGTSSWSKIGPAVLNHFAAREDYNLIFAPHTRLFDPPQRHATEFRRWQGLDHIRIDLGSMASINMSYVAEADVYLGDISSQVLEFLLRPRPCIFLNSHKLQWHDDPSFVYWRLGPVVEDLSGLDSVLAARGVWQADYEANQRRASAIAFPSFAEPAPMAAAHAIATFLRLGHLPEEPRISALSVQAGA